MRRPLIVATLLFGGLVAVWGALVLLDLMARTEERSVRPLDLRGGALSLRTDSGDLEVVAAAGPARLEVRSTTGLFGGPGTRVSPGDDGALFVQTNCTGPFSLSCSGSLRVLVPPGTRVTLSTGSGELDVRGTRGGVLASTGSGDIDLTDVAGADVVAETGSGDVTGRGMDARRLRAKTGSGEVGVALVRPPEDVVVDTGSGDADLRVPDAGYAFALDTGSGDERVGVRQDPASPRRIRMTTGSGDITVRPAR